MSKTSTAQGILSFPFEFAHRNAERSASMVTEMEKSVGMRVPGPLAHALSLQLSVMAFWFNAFGVSTGTAVAESYPVPLLEGSSHDAFD